MPTDAPITLPPPAAEPDIRRLLPNSAVELLKILVVQTGRVLQVQRPGRTSVIYNGSITTDSVLPVLDPIPDRDHLVSWRVKNRSTQSVNANGILYLMFGPMTAVPSSGVNFLPLDVGEAITEATQPRAFYLGRTAGDTTAAFTIELWYSSDTDFDYPNG